MEAIFEVKNCFFRASCFGYYSEGCLSTTPSFSLLGVNLIDFSNFLDDDGIFTSVQEVFIKPKIEDHGKQVKCEASIKDNENVTLYNAVAATEAFELDIKFPPQPSENQTLNANKGKEYAL